MNSTAIIITGIICGTILCIFGMSLAVSHKQKKNANKTADRLLKSIFDESEDK